MDVRVFEELNREEYLHSISMIKDESTKKFALMALEWWDSFFSWNRNKCRVLTINKQHVAYIFSHNNKNKEYVTIHNIFTPLEFRRQNYGYTLLNEILKKAFQNNIRRLKLSVIPKALPFYKKLGLVYWGINRVGDFYCDLPLNKNAILGIDEVVKNSSNQDLLGDRRDYILSKVQLNHRGLKEDAERLFLENKTFLGESYRYDELIRED